jgi:WD40 repeat protein
MDNSFWDIATGRQRENTQRSPQELPDAIRDPTGKTRVVARLLQKSRTIILVDIASGAERRLEAPCSIRNLAFSPDGRTLAVGGQSGSPRLWDVPTGQVRADLNTSHIAGIRTGLAFSPDSKLLATAGDDATVRLWDVATGQEQRTLRGHTDVVWAVAFSPDNRRLASAGFDGTCKVWDPSSGDLLATLKGHPTVVWDVFFSSDGNELISWDRTRFVVWRTARLQ